VTRAIRDSDDVLVCRLIKGKVTFVHRRLWPALVRAAGRLRSDRLSQVREVHTSSGRHATTEVPFPDWVPPSVRAAAQRLSMEAALTELAAWIDSRSSARPNKALHSSATRGTVSGRG
jgi:hypothetical protein